MNNALLHLSLDDWACDNSGDSVAHALETGKVLFFPQLAFPLRPAEQALLTPDLLTPKARNISFSEPAGLSGAAGSESTLLLLEAMMQRFRRRAQSLIQSLMPRYTASIQLAATSFRPMEVRSRQQSWRADDRRLHVDAFPSRPINGARILRVFTNINPDGAPRVWRIGEPFEQLAQQFLPNLRPYTAWQARMLQCLRITKSLRSEYDHLMLQLHDNMKRDIAYQDTAPQVTMSFPAGSTWVCFSDQVPHASMAGQHMLEQTLHLPAAELYQPHASPLAVLQSMTGRPLLSPHESGRQ